MIENVMQDRIISLKTCPFSGNAVIYVMSRDQRIRDNHAIFEAQKLAIINKKPLYVLFVLGKKGYRSREHYSFMLNGIRQIKEDLNKLNINFILRYGKRIEIIPELARETNCGALLFDFSPLTSHRSDIKAITKLVKCQVHVIDSHNIIPVWQASEKQEYAAYTFRAKVHNLLARYLVDLPSIKRHPFNGHNIGSLSCDDLTMIINSLPSSGIKIKIPSGEAAAHHRLKEFLHNDLHQYSQLRNNFDVDGQSGLSPYLHFGQISSLRVAIDTINHVNIQPLLLSANKLVKPKGENNLEDGMNDLFEELIVRKELADNFCFYNENYKSIKGAPSWARKTLDEHLADKREYLYKLDDWEATLTHDNIWNSAQIELLKTGKMHGYLRMYWAKKILEWSVSPEEALNTAIYLNDKYSIDGADPNGYVGILWSIAGLHDRPWFDRPVFGHVRYMNKAGLRRKYNVTGYINRVNSL